LQCLSQFAGIYINILCAAKPPKHSFIDSFRFSLSHQIPNQQNTHCKATKLKLKPNHVLFFPFFNLHHTISISITTLFKSLLLPFPSIRSPNPKSPNSPPQSHSLQRRPQAPNGTKQQNQDEDEDQEEEKE